jgi:polyadenylate-binding protein 2
MIIIVLKVIIVLFILIEADKFSVYVKNVDYDACPEDLEEHFKHCGLINRITILIDKYTGLPKG